MRRGEILAEGKVCDGVYMQVAYEPELFPPVAVHVRDEAYIGSNIILYAKYWKILEEAEKKLVEGLEQL